MQSECLKPPSSLQIGRENEYFQIKGVCGVGGYIFSLFDGKFYVNAGLNFYFLKLNGIVIIF